MRFSKCAVAVMALATVVGCCLFPDAVEVSPAAPLADAAWEKSRWIAVPDAPVATEKDRNLERAAPGTSWFVGTVKNAKRVVSAKWMTAGLGVYELYLNGRPIGTDEALKPGFTNVKKTRRSFTYDVTAAFRCAEGEANVLAAEVSAGWWRDQIVSYTGRKSAFRGVLALTYGDGQTELFGTDEKTWTCAVGGPVKRAGIFDGQIHDARVAAPTLGGPDFKAPEVSTEFAGKILPNNGAEIRRRTDLALPPVEAYAWKGATGVASNVFGTVVKTRTLDPKGVLSVIPGETLVVDFGQNCAGVPAFEFAAKPGVTLTCLPGEMLNDANGERARGNDGPAGSLYRENLRIPASGMRLEYTFATDKVESFMPRFTFFGYRYVSITATDVVTIRSVKSIPVTSIAKDMELGSIETGDKTLNRFIKNVYWGQLSNYLSVPTDCPQRNERLGWTADTQVFCEAGAFNADTRAFFHKWMRDMRDSQHPKGGFPGVAPFAQYGNDTLRVGWSDAGVIVPYQIWKQFGDRAIVDENWDAMERLLRNLAETRASHEANVDQNKNYQWNDWLSLTKYESCPCRPELSAFKWTDGWTQKGVLPDALKYWNYLLSCYWMWDAELMREMAAGTGRTAAVKTYERMVADAKNHLKANFLPDGLLLPIFRDMQTPALFALKLGLVEGAAKAKTLEMLQASIRANGGRLHTGFLGTSIAMDTLTENGLAGLAYDILLGHEFPGWLYSVDQGATTVWERWNSYVKATGFGPVGMNSFNHYAYGAVLAWIYRTAAGIAADPKDPGFRTVVMRPIPDRRLGFVKASYKSAAGLVKSAWRYEGETWIWEFTVPEGATARVTPPGENTEKLYRAGTYRIEK